MIELIILGDPIRKELQQKSLSEIMGGDKAYLSQSLHNVYLDFWYYSSFFTLLFFIVFLISLMLPFLRVTRRSRKLKSFPFYLGVSLSFLLILGAFYANPVLQLRYIWVFFGLMMTIVYINIREYGNAI